MTRNMLSVFVICLPSLLAQVSDAPTQPSLKSGSGNSKVMEQRFESWRSLEAAFNKSIQPPAPGACADADQLVQKTTAAAEEYFAAAKEYYGLIAKALGAEADTIEKAQAANAQRE